MDTPPSTFISKFHIREKDIYVKVLWKPNENDLFQIKVYDGQSSWSGSFSYEIAETFMECLDEGRVQYISSVKHCLGCRNSEFIYDFEPLRNNPKAATFYWKQIYEGAVSLHGTVPLALDRASESKDTLIDFLILENKSLKQRVDEYNEKNNELSGDLEKVKSEMENFVNIKTSLESSLYGKFVQLLNAKKRRIQLLEENMHKSKAKTTISESELD